jgi:RHH-type proline utilization regulon transcriptional repressor/proline dehydrogenase/delta 1-pyrroline-5-carboxylate dehydrogenase
MKNLRQNIRQNCYLPDESVLKSMAAWAPSGPSCEAIAMQASIIVETLRNESAPSMMELFLGEYGLSSEEGVAR